MRPTSQHSLFYPIICKRTNKYPPKKKPKNPKTKKTPSFFIHLTYIFYKNTSNSLIIPQTINNTRAFDFISPNSACVKPQHSYIRVPQSGTERGNFHHTDGELEHFFFLLFQNTLKVVNLWRGWFQCRGWAPESCRLSLWFRRLCKLRLNFTPAPVFLH